MFLIDDILLSPIKAPMWIGKKIKELVDQQLTERYDIEKIKEDLRFLQERRQAGAISDEDFVAEEERLVRNLQEAQEFHGAGGKENNKNNRKNSHRNNQTSRRTK